MPAFRPDCIVHYSMKFIIPVVQRKLFKSRFEIVDFLCYFHRNVFSRRCQITHVRVSSGVALFASLTVTTAAVDGISLLMVQSVQLQQPLMV